MKTKKLEDIQKGEVILTAIRKVKGGKVDFEFAEIIESAVSTVNRNSDGGFAQMMNEGDDRFGRSARRAWQGAEPEAGKKYFPQLADQIDQVASGEYGNTAEINWLNPHVDGTPVHVEVIETTTPNRLNVLRGFEESAKQDGNGNYLLTEDGEYIFSNTRAVLKDEANHTFLQHDKITADFLDGKLSEEGELRADIVGDAQEQEEEQPAMQPQESALNEEQETA